MNTHTVWLTLMSSATLAAANNLPDAGSVSRDAETAAPAAPAAPPPVIRESADKAASDAADSTPFEVRDIRISGVSLLPESEIRALVQPYIGANGSLGGLRRAAAQITEHYRRAGYPLVTAVVPPQRMENGVAEIRVSEGRLGEVKVENASRLRDDVVQAYLQPNVRRGSTLHEQESGRSLLLLRDLAGTSDVSYRLNPTASGETDVFVALGQAKLLDGSVSVDNYGSKSTGRIRTRAHLNINSPLGRGERFSVQAMSSFKGVNYARLAADMPLGHQGLTLSLGAAHTRYDLGGAFKDLDASGNADSADVSLRYPLLRSNRSNVWLNGGGEWRSLKDEVGATGTVTRKSLGSVNFGADAGFQDDTLAGGYTRLSLTNTLGRLNIRSADARALDAVAAKTDGGFYKLNASVTRTQFFTPQFSFSGSLNGQWANKNLDSAEQMSVGGADGMAAYRSNDVSADIGLSAHLETRYTIRSNVSLLGFFDTAKVRPQRKPYGYRNKTLSLYGAGVGLDIHYKNFSLQSKLGLRGSDYGVGKRALVWLKAAYAF